jgi:dTDP-4-amino-4,6-dideoxygalactose transaminase
MIKLFDPENYTINTSKFSNILHDNIVTEFEENFANYVGAKYSCSINSATNAIFLLFLNKGMEIKVPSMIPPVVLNALITSGNSINFVDNIDWIGNSYILHDFGNYKIIDSAQKVERNQFKKEANPYDLMIFSHYPTKPVGGCDGGMIVSDDYEKISWLKEAVLNGMAFSENNWDRKIKFPGYKMYMNSIQAFIANKNLEKLEDNKVKIERILKIYNENLGYINESNHLYRIEVNHNKKFIEYMKENEVICGVHYLPQHKNPIYSKKDQHCPISEKASEKTVSIPFHPNLTDNDLDKIIKLIQKYE